MAATARQGDQVPVPTALTSATWLGELLRAGVGLLATDVLMPTATRADRAEARSLLLAHYGVGGVMERAALCEVLRQMTTPAAVLTAWLSLDAQGAPAVSVDAAMTWLLAALAGDSTLQRRIDSRARRAEERDAAAQVIADGLRLLAPALVDLPTLATWLTVAEDWAREDGIWPLDDVCDADPLR